jgi:hypothetical protein
MKDRVEELREKLHKAIENYGKDSLKTLKISRQLDKYILKEMKKK